MGRNKKIGLDYFPLDVDFFSDIKIRKLIRRQGGRAIAVYALLLCIIYKDGYYLRWDEELLFIVSEQTGYDEDYIREVIKCCVSIGLFDVSLYEKEGVLTSSGIQERYSSICRNLRRTAPIIEFNLLPTETTPVIAEEMPVNQEQIPFAAEETNIPTSENEIKRKIYLLFFLKNFANPYAETIKFYGHYASQGWEKKNGMKITDKVELADTWEPKKKEPLFPEPVSQLINEIYKAAQKIKDRDLLCEITKASWQGQIIKLSCTQECSEFIEHNITSIAPRIKKIFGAEAKLSYNFVKCDCFKD